MIWTVCHPSGAVTKYEARPRWAPFVDVMHRTARGDTFDWQECPACGAAGSLCPSHRDGCPHGLRAVDE